MTSGDEVPGVEPGPPAAVVEAPPVTVIVSPPTRTTETMPPVTEVAGSGPQNKFQTKEKNTIPVFKVDEQVQTLQVEKLKALKLKRDNSKVIASLKTLHEKAISGENLMPAVLEAVENYCTLGEISYELRKIFGEYK